MRAVFKYVFVSSCYKPVSQHLGVKEIWVHHFHISVIKLKAGVNNK